ncbi:hypothetical protein D6777_01170 [Candidatus Woesearchaeota archaeon]|nr:MAG: hypothetical protein D6777_01170 [Candidatus Woesearchaeota archaeon]
MIKKVSLFLVTILLLSSFTSAGFFSEFFSDAKLTGAVTGNSCLDKDAGNDAQAVRGAVSVNNMEYLDTCTKNGLLEATCGELDNIVYELYPCYECNDGACTDTEIQPVELGEDCLDMDSGLDFYTASEAKTSGYSFEDYCEDGKTIVEFACMEDNLVVVKEKCSKCENGKCISPEEICVDSDEGNNFVKGELSYQGESYTDLCVDSTSLVEYLCKDGKADKELVECSSGCKDGACVSLGFPTPSNEKPSNEMTELLLKRIEDVTQDIDEKASKLSGEDKNKLEEGKTLDERLKAILTLLRLSSSKLDLVDAGAIQTSEEYCGDNVCNDNEDDETCPEDCEESILTHKDRCGNGVCNDDEDRETCPEDCEESILTHKDRCGNGVCNDDEDKETCPEDCKKSREICSVSSLDFDNKCDENSYSAAKFECTDGYSDSIEDMCMTEDEWKAFAKNACSDHCETFSPTDDLPAFCGDHVCQQQESMIICRQDCLPSPRLIVCGDGTCNSDYETPLNCREDCGAQVSSIKEKIKAWIKSFT